MCFGETGTPQKHMCTYFQAYVSSIIKNKKKPCASSFHQYLGELFVALGKKNCLGRIYVK